MSFSLTRVLANAGISAGANALFPGAGLANAFARNATMGVANGVLRSGGKGAPEGAMPTRRFGSTRETAGELRSGFRDWLVDPLQAKKEKREQARDTALAVRLGMTGGEYSLTHRPAMSLIKKRSGDVQTNLMLLQFRVQQFMARNLSAIASTLGVSRSKIGHEELDPSRTWFGHLLSSMASDLKKIPLIGGAVSTGKHIVNIARILNPLTHAARFGRGAKKFGEFLQRLAVGKEALDLMKDPNKLYEKANIKTDFQSRAINLMKVNNEYQKRQLDMLFNVVTIGEKLLGVFGQQHKRVKTGWTFDEYSGDLKTEEEALRDRQIRERSVDYELKIASRSGLVGRGSAILAGMKNVYQKIQSSRNPNKANDRDKFILSYIMENRPDLLTGFDTTIDNFVTNNRNTDFKRDQAAADALKSYINQILGTKYVSTDRVNKQKDLGKTIKYAGGQATKYNMFDVAARSGGRAVNALAWLTGISAPDTGKNEHIAKQRNIEKYGYNASHAHMMATGLDERLYQAGLSKSVPAKVARALLGPLAGLFQQSRMAGIQNKVQSELRTERDKVSFDDAMGIGQTFGGGPGGGTGGLSPLKVNAHIEDFAQNAVLKVNATLVGVSPQVVGVISGLGGQLKTGFDSSLQKFGNDLKTNLSSLIQNEFLDAILIGAEWFGDYIFDKASEIRRQHYHRGTGWDARTPALATSAIEYQNLGNNQPQNPWTPNDLISASQKKPLNVKVRTNALGNVFSGGNISDYSNKIVTQPTLFNYDELHKFANGAGLMGEAGAEAIVPLERGKNGKLGVNTTDEMPVVEMKGFVGNVPSAISVIMVNEKGKPIDFEPLRAGFDSQMTSLQSGGIHDKLIRDLSIESITKLVKGRSLVGSFSKLTGLSKPKTEDPDDNVKTAAEREKDVEEKIEKAEQKKKEEQQQENEEEKKTLLQKISDFLDPNSKINKLREKIKNKIGDKFSLSSLWENAPDLLKKLGIGALAGFIYSQFSEQINGFLLRTVGSAFNSMVKYLEDNGPSILGGIWEHFKEHPIVDGALFTMLFPGVVGTAISKIGLPLIKKIPFSLPLVVGMGGMVYSLVDAFSHSKDESGGFSIGNFLKEFFFGSDGGIGGTLSKAASFGWMGAKIGAMFGGVGAVPGMLIGAAIGTLVGSTDSRDEQGKFSWGKFFKNLFLGNNSAGGLANGLSQSIKWGLVGGAVGGPIGFLLGTSIGGLLGAIGADGFKKIYAMGEASGQTVAKYFKWEKGSFAYKAATCGAANAIPYVGAFIFGALGSILDLGSMMIKGLWGWVKSFLPDSVVNWIEGDQTEYEKKFNEGNKNEFTLRDDDDEERKVKVNDKDATYINGAKDENEKQQRIKEIETKNNKKIQLGNEAERGVNGKKYNPDKYVALKEKWEKEDHERGKIYAHKIDLPKSNIFGSEDIMFGIDDFNTTKENAEQYNRLIDAGKTDEAIRFAKEVKKKQNEEESEINFSRFKELQKIRTPDQSKAAGSSPDDLKLDAQRKASSAPAAMAAKMGVGDDDDDEPEIVDIRESTPAPTEPKKETPSFLESIRLNASRINSGEISADENDFESNLAAAQSSVPAAAKASEDASKKKDESKGKSGTPAPSASPAPAPSSGEMPAPAPSSGETPASTPSGGGELNWIEKLISNTIQGAFKFGGAVVNAAKTAYNNAQQTVNGGPGAPGDPGGGGAVGSWGGGFSNAEYLPGKPGAASLGTHFITAKPKDPGNRPGRNNNPLNVKLHKLGTDKADDKGHRIFGNVDDGIRGNFWQLQRYINGTYQQGRFGQLNTARKIIPVWAPVKDGNDPVAYLKHLQQYGVDIDAPIDLNSPSSLDPLAKLMSGMAREEGWGIINPEEIKKVLTYGNHQGAPGTAQSTGDAAAAPTSAPEAVRNYLAIMGKNAQGARYDNDLRNKPGYYDCSSFTARSLADAGIFPRSVVDGKNAPTTGDLPIYLKRYGFKFHPYNFRGVKTAPPELQPGDILTANKAETGGSMGHVVTYWGDNKIIAAHRKRTNPEVGIKPFYTSKQGGYWRYSPGGGSNPEDLLNKTGQTTAENAILPNSAKTPSLFKKLKKTLGSTKLSWPTISSKVNSDYGTRDPSQFAGAKGKISRTHGGVDIQAAEGDPVYATMSGTVVGTDPDYGTIEVQHPNGWLSKYLHLGKFIARAGEQVKSGQIIGEAGGVGKGGKTDAFNPHLHFELIKDKTKIPPLPMVAAAGIDKPTKREQLENSNAAGYGGPEFTPRINKQMNEYLENNGVGGPEISVKSDNRVIVELKKLQMIMIGVMKAAGKPSIAVSAPQEQGDPKSKGVDGGKFDNMTENMFSQLGGMLGDLNVATTGLGTQIA